MTPQERGVRNAECAMNPRGRRLGILVAAVVAAATGCQQKMANQPAPRPLDESAFFADGRSARPLEQGVVHRAQRLDSDPLVTGLTAEEWARFWKHDPQGNAVPKVDIPAGADQATKDKAETAAARKTAFGAPRYFPKGYTLEKVRKNNPNANPDPSTLGDVPEIYATEFPFEITDADLRRGQRQYSVYCAVCHGPAGNGKGKIWERGFLKPTSYHTAPVEPNEPAQERDGRWYDVGAGEIPLGYSRGYWRWGIEIPVRDVPPGYIFEVITKGFGAMPDHASQIKPEDRWRIVAYVRTLQFSRAPDQFGEGVKK